MKYYLNIIKVTFHIYKRNVDLSMEFISSIIIHVDLDFTRIRSRKCTKFGYNSCDLA